MSKGKGKDKDKSGLYDIASIGSTSYLTADWSVALGDWYKKEVDEITEMRSSLGLQAYQRQPPPPPPPPPPAIQTLTPSTIVHELDKWVIGQDRAKKALAVGAYFHYFRIRNQKKLKFNKSNICMVGPTGTGKTYLLSRLAEILNVPFCTVDANQLTPDGYVGKDVGSFVDSIKKGPGQSPEEAIIFIDEADKLSSKHGSSTFKTYEIQQALLKVIEGQRTGAARTGATLSDIFSSGRNLDTTKMLFVIGGAFSFMTNSKTYKGDVKAEDLVKYGLMPEFVGRFPVITTLDPLRVSDLELILTKAGNNIIEEFTYIFYDFGCQLRFTSCAISAMAKVAYALNCGARGLRGVVERVLNESLFSLPDKKQKKLVVDSEMVEKFYGKPAEPKRYTAPVFEEALAG